MSVRTIGRLFSLLLFAALVFTGYLFAIQNSLRTTRLSLNLGPVGAWRLAQPVPVLAVVGVAFGAGFLLSALWFGVRSARMSRRLRMAEQQLALKAESGSERSEWR
jgi:hypothetical protein